METARCALEVRIHGRPVREYFHDNQIWIEGRRGSDFTLRLSNRGPGRILMVPSIDGLSVMDGEAASYDDRGYVVPGYGHIDVPGWRLNNNEVAKFCFNDPTRSYAEKSGQGGNLGVVGCAVFEEQPVMTVSQSSPFTRYYGRRGSQGMDRGPSYNVGVIQEIGESVSCYGASLGTEFGARSEHKVGSVSFTKATTNPAVVMSIRYGDRDELHRRGVDLAQKPVVAGEPLPFPAEQGCQPPPSWKGR